MSHVAELGPRSRRGPGYGAIDHRYPNRRIVATALPDEMVEQLRALALANGIALGEQIRRMLEKALEHVSIPAPEEGEETS